MIKEHIDTCKTIPAIDDRTKEHLQFCQAIREATKLDVAKVLNSASKIESDLKNIIERLEKVKDTSKDDKIELNKQLFALKQEISDLKSKIEPLFYITKGIK